jgi:hypothetical protein
MGEGGCSSQALVEGLCLVTEEEFGGVRAV